MTSEMPPKLTTQEAAQEFANKARELARLLSESIDATDKMIVALSYMIKALDKLASYLEKRKDERDNLGSR